MPNPSPRLVVSQGMVCSGILPLFRVSIQSSAADCGGLGGIFSPDLMPGSASGLPQPILSLFSAIENAQKNKRLERFEKNRSRKVVLRVWCPRIFPWGRGKEWVKRMCVHTEPLPLRNEKRIPGRPSVWGLSGGSCLSQRRSNSNLQVRNPKKKHTKQLKYWKNCTFLGDNAMSTPPPTWYHHISPGKHIEQCHVKLTRPTISTFFTSQGDGSSLGNTCPTSFFGVATMRSHQQCRPHSRH